MKKKELIRDYHFSDANLKQDVDKVLRSVQRDNVKFATRGITPAIITTILTQSTNFGDILTDVELLADVESATADKNTAAENLRIAIRTIRTMAANKFTDESPKYSKYGFEDINKPIDDKLFRLGKRVVRVANIQLTDLASEGLTAPIITSLGLLVNTFDVAIDVKEDVVNTRDIKTQERVDSGNALYKEMVRLCSIGKDLFASSDPARYNDYIIYDTPTVQSVPTPPANPI